MDRIGPKMQRAANYVALHPGCSMIDVARVIAPGCIGRNNAVGYNPVHRAVSAGLVVATKDGPRGAYRLWPPATLRAAVASAAAADEIDRVG